MKRETDNTLVLQVGEHDLQAVWKTYAYWAFWVGVAFFSVYPSCNWITSQRADVYRLYFDAELAIPFVPEFFWLYMSLYLLFLLPPFFLGVSQLVFLGKRIIAGTLISGLVFLLLPSRLGFERIVPEGFYGGVFGNLFALDLPHNMAPSLHIVYSAFILLAIYASSHRKVVRISVLLWIALIALSTLMVHQHHLIDIISATGIVVFVNFKLIKGESDV